MKAKKSFQFFSIVSFFKMVQVYNFLSVSITHELEMGLSDTLQSCWMQQKASIVPESNTVC